MSETKKCKKCGNLCLSCDNQSNCLTCKDGIGRNTSNTNCSCKDGFYDFAAEKNSTDCGKCEPPCKMCSGSYDNCASCLNSYIKKGNKC